MVDYDPIREAEADARDTEENSPYCPACGEDLDRDCMGMVRCPVCDSPCPHCYDGGY